MRKDIKPAQTNKTPQKISNLMTDQNNWLSDYTVKRDALIAANAYDPAHEHANCGVGLVASVDGTARRDVVEKSIQALKNVWHRGAVDADGKTGDGAGIRLDIPQEFFRAQIERAGHKLSLIHI